MQHETLELTKLLTVGLLRLNLCLHRAGKEVTAQLQVTAGPYPLPQGGVSHKVSAWEPVPSLPLTGSLSHSID
jgi:hypothetical protein